MLHAGMSESPRSLSLFYTSKFMGPMDVRGVSVHDRPLGAWLDFW